MKIQVLIIKLKGHWEKSKGMSHAQNVMLQPPLVVGRKNNTNDVNEIEFILKVY